MKGKMRFSLKTGQHFFRSAYNLQQKEKAESHILELLANKIYTERGSYEIYCLTD